jgi:very-short-patch-repair endonuclease
MFDLLVERGYRVDTQVPVGTKRIDLVVEGGEDRRLAIECDGDAFHGPDRWPEDMARQRMLERAGWTVWRCFASRFVRDRDGVLGELVQTLSALGILPTGADALPSRFTEQRTWRAVYEEEAGEPVPYAWLVPDEPFGARLPLAAE